MLRTSWPAALGAAALVLSPLSLPPALAGPGDKAQRAERRRQAEEAARKAEREKQVAALVERLRAPDPVGRLYVTWNLQALLPDSWPPLRRLLQERDPKQAEVLVELCGMLGEEGFAAARGELEQVALDAKLPLTARLSALIALAKLQDGEAQAFLDRVTRDQAALRPLRQAALMALGMIGAPGTGAAAEPLLRDPDPVTRFFAFRAIGYSQDRRWVQQCLQGLSDPDALTASMAAKALGKLADPATTDRLVEVAKKTRWKALWFFILEALGRLSHQPALDELLRLVQDPKFAAQTDAATFLFEVGERRALPIFRRLLEEALRGKHQPGLDTITAYALGAMADPESAPALTQALTKGRLDVRREAATALGHVGDAAGVAPLLATLGSGPDRPLRIRALIALGRLGGVEAVKAVQQALKDKEASVRWAAIVALEARRDPALVPTLQPLTRDAEPFVVRAAQEAIALLQGTPGLTPDPRREAILLRLRALEREVLLRLQSAGIDAGTPIGPPPVIPPPPDPSASTWEFVVGYESYYSTCGGTHPPIEYRLPIYEKYGSYEQARAAWEQERDRARQEWMDQNAAAAAARTLQRERLDESYELKNLKSDGERVREQQHAPQSGNGGGAGATGGQRGQGAGQGPDAGR